MAEMHGTIMRIAPVIEAPYDQVVSKPWLRSCQSRDISKMLVRVVTFACHGPSRPEPESVPSSHDVVIPRALADATDAGPST